MNAYTRLKQNFARIAALDEAAAFAKTCFVG